ncbi:Cof-type HAD-IIB family hydrolase [Fuchsiella alkaliacetigena]|uniref:Cof-type HAD-IIB family hydrolase n=1 Tax=Fuchsiella alkaliacetigena TaxID=957042 RepID=UPI00200B76F9|nr:Cof-type HAD-IIB family hydrolase [Fuchsiella alkaliacetigena]MCK8824072.1 Cof-type HAD-IIB family hydrolase [Fuchsiella alkaliacetigena]
MTDYKLLAIDIDDTLLSDELVLTSEIKQTIQAAITQGVEVTLATGRMYSSALPYAQQLELQAPIITYNGALVKSPVSKEVFKHQPISLELAQQVATLAASEDWHLNIYQDDQLYVNKMGVEVKEYEQIAGIKATLIEGALADFLTTAPTKLLVLAKDFEEARQINLKLQEVFAERLSVTKSKDRFVEIMQAGVSKGVALLDLARDLGIDYKEVIAIGDSLNDLEMIKEAGLGVAVANANPELKEEADYITASNEENGVAEVIKKFILR